MFSNVQPMFAPVWNARRLAERTELRSGQHTWRAVFPSVYKPISVMWTWRPANMERWLKRKSTSSEVEPAQKKHRNLKGLAASANSSASDVNEIGRAHV